MENILELHQVSKTYPKSDFTLDSLSLSLPYGAILGFVGENGAGKTTTIDCILNTVRKDSGTVKLFGREMGDEDTDIREKIGVVYDGDNFPGFWTATHLSRVMAGLYAQWDDALFQKYLEEFRLPPRQKIRSYSRGMTMKLALAAALSHHPQLLILDEATSGLDPIMRADIIKSYYTAQLIWLFWGMLFTAAASVLSSRVFRRWAFDLYTDLPMFALGISISLFLCAIFFPLFCWSREDRGEVFLVIALLCAIAVDAGLVMLLNMLLPEPGEITILCGTAAMTGCSALAFALSYPLTAHIYRKKEF